MRLNDHEDSQVTAHLVEQVGALEGDGLPVDVDEGDPSA